MRCTYIMTKINQIVQYNLGKNAVTLCVIHILILKSSLNVFVVCYRESGFNLFNISVRNEQNKTIHNYITRQN